MLEISWSELLILAVVTLVFVGPKELPVFLRTIGRYAGMLRRQANEFKAHFDEAMREAELAQMKEEMQKMQASVNAEVLKAEAMLKDAQQAGSIAPSQAQPAASFTAVAQAAVFPPPAATQQTPAATPMPPAATVPAQPRLDPQPATGGESEVEPPRPEVVKSEP